MNFIGEIAALATAFFFAFTALIFTSASYVRVDLSCHPQHHSFSSAFAVFRGFFALALAQPFRNYWSFSWRRVPFSISYLSKTTPWQFVVEPRTDFRFPDCLDILTIMNSIKTLVYMGSLHGFFTFYMPFQLATWDAPLFDLGILRYITLPFWTLGAWIIIHCCMDMVRGRGGTPAHMDPPKQLIITGLYRHVRNPIYLGALIALVGHILWSGSGWMIAYFLSYAVAFHILIVVFEEPVLRDKFGKQYKEYVANVPRWLPKWNKKDPHH